MQDDEYKQSKVVVQYVGHPAHHARDRSRHGPLPAHLDEVTVVRQPRGSYTLEVFRGYLAVGGETIVATQLA